MEANGWDAGRLRFEAKDGKWKVRGQFGAKKNVCAWARKWGHCCDM